MERTATDALENKPEPGAAAGDTPCGTVRDDRGSAVESDPKAIMAGLRGEMERVAVAGDSSCICIVSPDGTVDDRIVSGLGKLITSSLRSNDAAYRFADSKYLVMLRQIDRDGAVGFMKGLRDRIMSESPAAAGDDGNAGMTASFGGTMMDALAPLHEHMDRASEAHSWALKGMGDTICMWTPRF